MTILWIFFEVAGTIAFAISGALVGISRRMDIFGILVLALSTAIGGGIIRDVLVGNTPPNSFKSPLYITLTALTTLIIFIVYRQKLLNYRSKQKIRKYYLVADTLGLASFTVTGTTIGFSTYPQYPLLSITLGLVTAIGGGIIRDVLAQRIPSVLQEELYALPAILGSCVYLLIANFNLYLAVPISFLAVFIIRIIGIYYRLNLPRVN